MSLRLYVGNQRYSSWSMRPWICLKQAGLPFDTVVVRFDDPDFARKVPSPSKLVPLLLDGELAVHDSLAICEHIAELAPEAELWPRDRAARAVARALSSEMHSGFSALRNEASMDVCRSEAPGTWPLTARARADIARIDQLWSDAITKSGGPFLFGRFGVVDAMYAPVVTRFFTYSLPASDTARAYSSHMRELPAMNEWYRAGELERAAGWQHYAGANHAPRDQEEALHFALRWAEAWNARDVEKVLSHFADKVMFTSPKARAITGDPVVRGKDALRTYWTAGARGLPADMRFEILRADLAGGTNALTISYLRHTGGISEHASELLTFDPRTGLVEIGEAYYGA